MNFPIFIGKTGLFQILGVLGGIFHFYSNFNRTFYKQTVRTLIRRRVLRRLVWVCTFYLYPPKKDSRLICVNRINHARKRSSRYAVKEGLDGGGGSGIHYSLKI